MSIEIKIDFGDIDKLSTKLMILPDGIREEVYNSFNTICDEIVADAKGICPVRTGRLQHSIYGNVSRDLILKLGATAPYARYVEYGTSRMAPRAFLSTALWSNFPRLLMLTYQALQRAARERARWGR